MIDCMPYYDFESRKTVAIVFNGILKRQIGSRTPTADYIYNHQEILNKLLDG
jgi:calcium binding protein 39